jgi:hypothetical protein
VLIVSCFFVLIVFSPSVQTLPLKPVTSSRWPLFDCRLKDSRFLLAGNALSTRVADDSGNLHTPTMTLKNAALLALIGTILITALLVWTFILNFLNVLRGLLPALMLFSSFIYAFACFSVAVFFYVFHRAQS